MHKILNCIPIHADLAELHSYFIVSLKVFAFFLKSVLAFGDLETSKKFVKTDTIAHASRLDIKLLYDYFYFIFIIFQKPMRRNLHLPMI